MYSTRGKIFPIFFCRYSVFPENTHARITTRNIDWRTIILPSLKRNTRERERERESPCVLARTTRRRLRNRLECRSTPSPRRFLRADNLQRSSEASHFWFYLPLHPCIVLHYALQSSFQLPPLPPFPSFISSLPRVLWTSLSPPYVAFPPSPPPPPPPPPPTFTPFGFSISLSLSLSFFLSVSCPLLLSVASPSSTRRPVVSQGCTYRFISSCI